MRVIARSTLKRFWSKPEYRDAEQPLKAWFDEATKAEWKTPQDIKNLYRNASFVGGNRVVFNIHGNKFRLVVLVNYSASIVFIRFVGTHKQYDSIDAASI